MKKTLALVLSVLFMLGLVGCSKTTNLKEDDGTVSRRGPSISSKNESSESESLFSSQTVSSESAEESVSSKDTVSSPVSKSEAKLDDDSLVPISVKDPKTVKMSDNLFDFTIEVDGKAYQLPMTVHDFTADGWVYQTGDSEETYMDANSYFMLGTDFKNKDGKLVRVEVTNYASRKMKVENCYITGFSYPSYGNTDNRAVIKFSKGIELLKATADDVKKAYGDPTSYDTNSSGTIYNYKTEDTFYRSYTFNFGEDNVMKYFTVTDRAEVPDNYVEPPINTAAPDYVGDYKAPKELGSEVVSGRIQVDKVIYQLPCPLTVFLDDGWKVDEDDDEYGFVASGGSLNLTLTKQGYEIEVKVKNYTDLALTTEYAQVTYVSAYSYVTKDLNIAVPGGITMKSAATDLESGENAKIFYNEDGSDFYKAYKDNKENDYSHYLNIYADREDNGIYNISLTYEIDED